METLLDLQEIAWRIREADSVEERRKLHALLRETQTEIDSSELEITPPAESSAQR